MQNFDYLKIDEQYTKFITHSHASLFRKIGTNKWMRYIIANQKYDQYELDKLQNLKRALQDKHIILNGNMNTDIEMMRYINGDCQIATSIEYIEKAKKYFETATMDLELLQKKIFEKGIVYLGGRDKWLRPTIVVQANLIQKNDVDLFKQGMIFMFQLAIKYCFIDGQIENWNVIVETNSMSVLQIQFSVYFFQKHFIILQKILQEIIQMMKYLFPSRLHNIFITNPSTSLQLSWSIISEFIDKYQVDQVSLISKSEFMKIKRFYNPEQLEKKYGGVLKNFSQFWPPANTLTPQYLAKYYHINQDIQQKESNQQISQEWPQRSESISLNKNYSRSLTPDLQVSSKFKSKQKIFGEYIPVPQRQSTLILTSEQGQSLLNQQDERSSAMSQYPYFRPPRNYEQFNYEFQFEKDEFFQNSQPKDTFLQSYSQLMYQKKPLKPKSKDRGCFCGFCYSQKKKNAVDDNNKNQQKEKQASACYIF